MKLSKILIISLIGLLGSSLGMGWESIGYMFGDSYKYSMDGGQTWLAADSAHIRNSFIEGFAQGWAPFVLCLPFLGVLLALDKRFERKKRGRITSGLLLGITGFGYGVVLAFVVYAIVGGWGPLGLFGLAVAGISMGVCAPWIFRKKEAEQGARANAMIASFLFAELVHRVAHL